jgi:hypothetical protein
MHPSKKLDPMDQFKSHVEKKRNISIYLLPGLFGGNKNS